MTDYNKLAQRAVAQGIGECTAAEDFHGVSIHGVFWYGIGNESQLDAEEFCHDGRVVLAVLAKMEPVQIGLAVLNYGCENDCPGYSFFHDPVAILEAGLSALENEDE